MHAIKDSSIPVFKTGLRFGHVMFAALFILAMAATARGQDKPTPKPTPITKQPHWHKYVNHQYGFSFWYPDTYMPVPVRQLPPESDFYTTYKNLLALKERDDPEASITVSIDLLPFQMGPRGNAPTPDGHRIGHHVFYPYMGGSMAIGFYDAYEINLRGETLRFGFTPDHLNEPRDPNTEPPLPKFELKILETFRTF